MTPIGRLGFLARGALAAALVLPFLLAGAPAHAAAADDGLYGAQDPTYDGAFRQSLSILALQAAGERVPPAAIEWLVRQQCDDGGWTAYRKDVEKPCVAKKEDSNSTAMAVQALAAVGGLSDQVDRGVGWLTEHQNPDGGVGYNPGGATDANSTALFVQAIVAAGDDPTAATQGGNSPVDALAGLQVGCEAPRDERGAFTFQATGNGDAAPNDLATAAALFALSGQVLPVTQPGNGSPNALPCNGKPKEGDVAPAAAAYLGKVLDRSDGAIPAQQGGGDDLGTTASAAIALSAFGARDEASKAMAALSKQADTYAKGPEGEDAPAGLANLVLASVATGNDPTAIADNAVERLVATGPESPDGATSSPQASPAAQNGSGADQPSSAGSGSWIVAVVIGAVVLVGVAAALGRREEQADQ